jgi:hypothetical protein
MSKPTQRSVTRLTARLTALLALAASGGLVAQNPAPPRGSLERIEEKVRCWRYCCS